MFNSYALLLLPILTTNLALYYQPCFYSCVFSLGGLCNALRKVNNFALGWQPVLGQFVGGWVQAIPNHISLWKALCFGGVVTVVSFLAMALSSLCTNWGDHCICGFTLLWNNFGLTWVQKGEKRGQSWQLAAMLVWACWAGWTCWIWPFWYLNWFIELSGFLKEFCWILLVFCWFLLGLHFSNFWGYQLKKPCSEETLTVAQWYFPISTINDDKHELFM